MPLAPLATCASLEAVYLLCVFLALFFLCFEPILPTPPLVARHARPLRGRSVPDLDRNTEEAICEGMAERDRRGEAGLGRTMYLKKARTKRSRLFGSKETPLQGRHSDYL